MPRAAFALTAGGLACAALWLAASREPPPGPPPAAIRVRLSGHGPEDIRALRWPLAELRRRCALALRIEVPEISAERADEKDAPALEVRLGERVLAAHPGRFQGTGGELDVEAVVLTVFRALVHRADALIDLRALEAALEQARGRHPGAVREALKVLGPVELLELTRGFLRERVPLPPLPALLEAVAADPLLRQPAERPRWLERMRERLAGYWVRDVLAAHARLGPLRWTRPSPDAEAALLERYVVGEGGAQLRLSAAGRQAWAAQVVGPDETSAPLLVCSGRARPAFALLLQRSTPHIAVLAAGELSAVDLAPPGETGAPAVWFEAP